MYSYNFNLRSEKWNWQQRPSSDWKLLQGQHLLAVFFDLEKTTTWTQQILKLHSIGLQRALLVNPEFPEWQKVPSMARRPLLRAGKSAERSPAGKCSQPNSLCSYHQWLYEGHAKGHFIQSVCVYQNKTVAMHFHKRKLTVTTSVFIAELYATIPWSRWSESCNFIIYFNSQSVP